jgi:hypothetical protein
MIRFVCPVNGSELVVPSALAGSNVRCPNCSARVRVHSARPAKKAPSEADWLGDAAAMMECLDGRASERRVCLFAAACYRRIWEILPEGRRGAVDVLERFAEALASPEELDAAGAALSELAWDWPVTRALGGGEVWLAWWAANQANWLAARAAAGSQLSGTQVVIPWAVQRSTARKALAHAARCIFGNPFRPAAFDPAWRTWNGGAAVDLARAAYQARQLPAGTLDGDRFAILADALEEAGCADAQILGHCRDRGPHYQGCYVVDLVLGRDVSSEAAARPR